VRRTEVSPAASRPSALDLNRVRFGKSKLPLRRSGWLSEDPGGQCAHNLRLALSRFTLKPAVCTALSGVCITSTGHRFEPCCAHRWSLTCGNAEHGVQSARGRFYSSGSSWPSELSE